ncbi:uncharacterized protein LOC120382307 isoform X3 [Mauremys reevesii]|uniref:uncharacterized protein LOC120382307 isoform X3 n=1 Tax=Mauremys reevesii TaxID=260615 RepID=UPI00193F6D83|nr:uncharacterized protein LOC120382307 isoform X3 [Mauremys reevesii]
MRACVVYPNGRRETQRWAGPCVTPQLDSMEKPSFERLKSTSPLYKGQGVIKKQERKFILIFQTLNSEQRGGKKSLETEGKGARNEKLSLCPKSPSSKRPEFRFHSKEQSEEKKQEKKKNHRKWRKALNAGEIIKCSGLEPKAEETKASAAGRTGIMESPFFKRPESRFSLSNGQREEKKQKKKHKKWRRAGHTEEGDADALQTAAAAARIKKSSSFKRPESTLHLSNGQSQEKKREKKKKHRKWRRAEHTGGGDKDSLETEADEAESGLDVARAWTSQHTYLHTSTLFVSHTLSVCQELLPPPWLKPTSPLSKGQSDRKKWEGKQKHKQLGTQSKGGLHLQSQETEGADGRNEETPFSKRPESVFPLCNERRERKNKHMKWRTENTGEGDENGLETNAEEAAARMKKLGSSKRLKSSSALDIAQNEKTKRCTELTQRKQRRQENEGGGDAQRLESGRRNEETPPSKRLKFTSLLSKGPGEKKKDVLRQKQKKLRRKGQGEEEAYSLEAEGGAEKNKEVDRLKPTSLMSEGQRDKKERKQEKKHENRETTEDGGGGEYIAIEETGDKESCSFKRPRSASSLASISASENSCPHSPSPVPIKRRCSSKVAGSCNQGEFPKRPASETEIQFHTHQREGIQICDHFLLGNCPHGSICELHHTRYPYHWQIKRKDSQVWQSVNDSAQRHLEKLYSDIGRVHVKLIDKKALSGKVNLSTLKIDHHGPFSNIRRLSNTSHPEQNSYFPTEWTVYWEDGSIWKKYEGPLSHDFLAAFEDYTQEHIFQLRGHLYTMDFKQSLIYNHNTGNSHTIQLRPTYRSPLQMLPQLWTIPSSPSEMHYPPTSNILGEDPTDGYNGPYPAYWIKRPEGSVPFAQEEVLPSEAAYQTIYTLFHKSLSEAKVLLLSVHRIRNDFLWQKYCSQKDLMSQSLSAEEKLRLEKHLFHSTSAKRLEFTCQIKFDTHLSGSHMYGRGCYFSVNADQADRYSQAGKGGLRHMFLAKVLVGKCTRGKKHYWQPPQLESGRECFDSCVDNVASPNIYVIFNSYQCYPYFLISYKLLSDPVVLDD